MQNDLISRNALLSVLSKNSIFQKITNAEGKNVIEIINEQPIAYNLIRVVDKLEEELALADEEKRRCASENPLQFDEVKGYARGIDYAINVICGERDK